MKTQEANSNDVDETTNGNEINQEEERELLERLCEEVFSGNRKELAIALGRPDDEIDDLLSGEMSVDEDLMIKAHGLLQERAFSNS